MSIDAQAALASANSALKVVADAVAEKDADIARYAARISEYLVAHIALNKQVDSLSAANVGLQEEVNIGDRQIASLLATVNAANAKIADLQAKLDAATATIAALQAKLDELQPKPKTVFDYGAKGDGVTDDTLAIQKAIDAGDGRVPGKTPAGVAARFLINPLRVPLGTSFYGLLVGTGKRLVSDPEAVFVVKPNGAPRNMAIRVDGGYMEGGQVLGDRLMHNYSSGGTHEWGYGVQGRGTGWRIVNVRVSHCTGDGFGASGVDGAIDSCISTLNRRQGLSVFTMKGLKVTNSEFTKTGAIGINPGTNPRCGVDIEPDSGWAEDIVFDNCTITDNEVTGFVAWIRSEVKGGVVGLKINNCKITGVNAVHMKALAGSITARIDGSSIKRGGGSGLRIESGATVDVNNNIFAQPTARSPVRDITGTSSATKTDINVFTGGVAVVGTNRYV